NVSRLIRGFLAARRSSPELADHQLVVAGARWWGDAEASELRFAPENSVVMLGRVTDVQREHLLRTADALAYLSLYAGFGLPPIEAMARDTPVVVSDRTSIPEVTGGAALLVDPLDVDAIAAGLVEVVTDAVRRKELIEAGRVRAAQFSVTA